MGRAQIMPAIYVECNTKKGDVKIWLPEEA
jgi:hypothetical protein